LGRYSPFVDKPLRFWCQDESRFGLKTYPGRWITNKGIKPISDKQWKRKAYWLYGAAEPLTGEAFYMEFSHVDTDCFHAFLDCFSRTYPEEHHIMQIDNAAFHTSKKLNIPDNISLLAQPPHSPETNPIERVWAWYKSQLKNLNFADLEELKNHMASLIKNTLPDRVRTLTFWPHIQEAVLQL